MVVVVVVLLVEKLCVVCYFCSCFLFFHFSRFSLLITYIQHLMYHYLGALCTPLGKIKYQPFVPFFFVWLHVHVIVRLRLFASSCSLLPPTNLSAPINILIFCICICNNVKCTTSCLIVILILPVQPFAIAVSSFTL